MNQVFLLRKGLNVTYSDVIQMPINWIFSMNPLSKEGGSNEIQ
ncbi:MAG: hypothetical protein SVR08_14945 [Spirochaetota bacterium]|nr:hypothetical protein [Spirochaetota bacterium]